MFFLPKLLELVTLRRLYHVQDAALLMLIGRFNGLMVILVVVLLQMLAYLAVGDITMIIITIASHAVQFCH